MVFSVLPGHNFPARKTPFGEGAGGMPEDVSYRGGQYIEKAGGHLKGREIPIPAARCYDFHQPAIPLQPDAIRTGDPLGREALHPQTQGALVRGKGQKQAADSKQIHQFGVHQKIPDACQVVRLLAAGRGKERTAFNQRLFRVREIAQAKASREPPRSLPAAFKMQPENSGPIPDPGGPALHPGACLLQPPPSDRAARPRAELGAHQDGAQQFLKSEFRIGRYVSPEKIAYGHKGSNRHTSIP